MELNKYIDHTLLKPFATSNDIRKLCKEAKENHFYSVCVNPYYAELAKKELQNSEVKLAVVVGFPLGANTTEIKIQESINAKKDGADEIDMVMNIGAFKGENYDYVLNEINAIKENTNLIVKVIVETSLLSDEEIIKTCEIINESKADFIKTSTGFIGEGAKLEHIKLMKQHIKNGKKIKASGGIKDKATAIQMIEAGANRLGTSSGITIIK